MRGDASSSEPADRSRTRGPTLIESLVLIALLGIVAAVAIPQLLGAREKAKVATCDNLFVALNLEIANALDDAMMAHGSGDPNAPEPPAVLASVLEAHAGERNPRNRAQRAYVGYRDADPCQVWIVPLFDTFAAAEAAERESGTFEMLHEMGQRPAAGLPSRTFSVNAC